MAKLGEHRYFKRSGDSFYRMEHFDLEDMFGRRQKPKLSIRVVRRIEDLEGRGQVERLDIDVSNEGRAVAKHAGFFAAFENVELVGVSQLNSSYNNNRPTVSFSHDNGVIHPGGVAMHAGFVRLRRLDARANIVMRLRYYCEGARPGEERTEIPPFEPTTSLPQSAAPPCSPGS
jgi:hypothetical protein